jgi:hypothetical protein
MAEEPKPTLEQVKASVRDALRKLTGDPGPAPEIKALKTRKKPSTGPNPKTVRD